MPAARPTEAAIARAIRAAKREGCGVVEIEAGGAIRILVDGQPTPLPSPDESGEDEWDRATGASG